MGAFDRLFKLGFVVLLGMGAVALAHYAFTAGITTVIKAEVQAPVQTSGTSAMPVFDSECLTTSILNDAPANVAARCHAETVWNEEHAQPLIVKAPPIPEMSKDDSISATLWFMGAMVAGLGALGFIGAGAMWALRD